MCVRVYVSGGGKEGGSERVCRGLECCAALSRPGRGLESQRFAQIPHDIVELRVEMSGPSLETGRERERHSVPPELSFFKTD